MAIKTSLRSIDFDPHAIVYKFQVDKTKIVFPAVNNTDGVLYNTENLDAFLFLFRERMLKFGDTHLVSIEMQNDGENRHLLLLIGHMIKLITTLRFAYNTAKATEKINDGWVYLSFVADE